MKARDADILIVPDRGNFDADHWQSRWQRHLVTARWVEQDDWSTPVKARWVTRIVEETHRSVRPVVLVAHGLGAHAVAHAAPELEHAGVAGAFLVAPVCRRACDCSHVHEPDFEPVSRQALPFRSVLVASSNDPACSLEEARALAHDWRAQFVDAGACGHIDTASGHGPWPEGLLRFGAFLKQLG